MNRDELRAKRSIARCAIGLGIALKRHGRSYVGLCPFHKEKTPSFRVSEERGFYHCFGCGQSGDVLRLVSEMKGLSASDAHHFLETHAFESVDLPPAPPPVPAPALDEVIAGIFEYDHELWADKLYDLSTKYECSLDSLGRLFVEAYQGVMQRAVGIAEDKRRQIRERAKAAQKRAERRARKFGGKVLVRDKL